MTHQEWHDKLFGSSTSAGHAAFKLFCSLSVTEKLLKLEGSQEATADPDDQERDDAAKRAPKTCLLAL